MGSKRSRSVSLLRVAGPFLALTTVLGGCARQAPCLPEPLTVSPATAPAGSSVEVSSPAAACEIDYPPGTQYALTLRSLAELDSPGGADDAPTTVAPVAENGEFSATVDIPPDFPKGLAIVGIRGSTFDECGKNPPPGVSCAGYEVVLTVTE